MTKCSALIALKSVFLRRGPKIKVKTVHHLAVSILHGVNYKLWVGKSVSAGTGFETR